MGQILKASADWNSVRPPPFCGHVDPQRVSENVALASRPAKGLLYVTQQQPKVPVVLDHSDVAVRIMSPQRCPHLNPWNLLICYVTWNKNPLSLQTGTKDSNKLTLRERARESAGLSKWIQFNHCVLKCGWEREKGESQNEQDAGRIQEPQNVAAFRREKKRKRNQKGTQNMKDS